MLIIVDKRAPKLALKNLEKYGELLLFESSDLTYNAISGHPDIFFCQMPDNSLVVAPNSPKEFLKVLKNRNLSFKFGKNLVGEKYPKSAHYNAVVNSNFLIHNLQITDSEIINSCQDKKLINVRQGYVRCNLISLPDGSFICSDMGIYKELKKQNIEVLFVNPKGIELPDFPNGFIGGSMGFNNGKLFILGSLKYFLEGEKIEHFLKNKSIQIVELYDGALFDCGSLLFC